MITSFMPMRSARAYSRLRSFSNSSRSVMLIKKFHAAFARACGRDHHGIAEFPGAAAHADAAGEHHGEEICVELAELVRAGERRSRARLNRQIIRVRGDEMIAPSLWRPHRKLRAALLAIRFFALADFRDPRFARPRVQLFVERHLCGTVIANPGRLVFVL